jgi:hypothetical protein
VVENEDADPFTPPVPDVSSPFKKQKTKKEGHLKKTKD